MIESGVTIDYAVLVMDNDIARMCKYILRGIPTNDATLMVDEIVAVGSEKDFLSRKSTRDNMRAHQSRAGLIDRRVREEWEMDGSNRLLPALQREGQGGHRVLRGRAAPERRAGRDPRHREGCREEGGRRHLLSPGFDRKRDVKEREHMADFETLKEMIIAGDDHAMALTEKMLADGASARDILDQSLLPGMEVVGPAHEERRVLHPRGAPERRDHAGLPRPRRNRTWRPARAPRSARSSSAPSRATCTTSARTSWRCSWQAAASTSSTWARGSNRPTSWPP